MSEQILSGNAYSTICLIVSFILFMLSVKFKTQKQKENSSSESSRETSKTQDPEIKKQGLKYLNYLIDNLQKTIVSEKKENLEDDHPLKQLKADKEYEEGVIPAFTIVYATQSNTAKRFSERIAKDAQYLNIKTQIKNISEISIEDDFNKNIFLVFFVATYGEGGPSDDAIEFNRAMDKKTLFENFTNEKLNYAIFGLGSTKYEYYNQMAKKIDKFFARKKLARVCDVGLGDDSKDINKDFAEWRRLFWLDTYKNFSMQKDEIKALSNKLNLSSLYAKNEPEFFVFSNNSNTKENNADIAEKAKSYMHNVTNEDCDYGLRRFNEAVDCEVKEIKELRRETVNGSTLLIKYRTDKLKYQVGDNIGVYPVNSDNCVSDVISKLNFDADEKFEVKKTKSDVLKKKIDFPNNMTVKEILTNVVDLSAQINKDVLEKLKKYVIDEDQLETIEKILYKESKINEFLEKNYNICDLLKTYDSIKLDFLEFYSIMPKILPRFYTVASSPNKSSNEFEIVISLVNWNGINNENRFGLASAYYKNLFQLSNLNKNLFNESSYKTRIIIRDSSFRLPQSPETPMVLMATGTGIAPYIGFLQEMEHRSTQNQKANPIIMLFGSKNKLYDFIYEEEILKWKSQNLIGNLYLAFSRDQENKFYIQNIISQNAELMKDAMSKGVIYVCGGVSMGHQVNLELEKIFTKEGLKKKENENEYIKEFWGK